MECQCEPFTCAQDKLREAITLDCTSRALLAMTLYGSHQKHPQQPFELPFANRHPRQADVVLHRNLSRQVARSAGAGTAHLSPRPDHSGSDGHSPLTHRMASQRALHHDLSIPYPRVHSHHRTPPMRCPRCPLS
jgi:hypothetical protein